MRKKNSLRIVPIAKISSRAASTQVSLCPSDTLVTAKQLSSGRNSLREARTKSLVEKPFFHLCDQRWPPQRQHERRVAGRTFEGSDDNS